MGSQRTAQLLAQVFIASEAKEVALTASDNTLIFSFACESLMTTLMHLVLQIADLLQEVTKSRSDLSA